MPIIIAQDRINVIRQGEGWQEILLAGHQAIGSPAITARRWSFQAVALGPELVHGDYDEMLYVISGGGTAQVNGQVLELSPESVLWLEAGDRYRIQAGSAGLELLQGIAPEDLS
jgi:quercetin dioxygenase-like cupin family protein